MIGKLVNENYFLDPTSGLAFKLNLIIMGKLGNNLQKIHDEVMRISGLCRNEAEECLPTLGLFPSVWEAAMADHASYLEMLASETRCLAFLGKEQVDPQNVKLPYGFPEMSFVWNGSNNKVYPPYNSNNLGHRYKALQPSQIPSPTLTPTPTPMPGTPGTQICCPECGHVVFVIK